MEKNFYEERMKRIMYLLGKLDEQKVVRVSDVAKRFGVTRRAVQKDIELLKRSGFLIKKVRLPGDRRNIGYKFKTGFRMQKIEITPEEKEMLFLFYRLFDKAGKPYRSIVRNFLDKILTINKEDVQQIKKRIEASKYKQRISEKIERLASWVDMEFKDKPFSKPEQQCLRQLLGDIGKRIHAIKTEEQVAITIEEEDYFLQENPLLKIHVPNSYFNDPRGIVSLEPQDYYTTFEIEARRVKERGKSLLVRIKTDVYLNVVDPYLNKADIICFDDFVEKLGFKKEDKSLSYLMYGCDGVVGCDYATIVWIKELSVKKCK